MKFIKELIAEFSIFPQQPNVDDEMEFSVNGDEGSISDLEEPELDDEGNPIDMLDQDLGLDAYSTEGKPMCQCPDEESGEDFDSMEDGEYDEFTDDFGLEDLGNISLSDLDLDTGDEEEALNLFPKASKTTPKEKFKFIGD